jgi:DNA adenine methylase
MREIAEMSVAAHILTPPLKWHGGKHYLASRIVGLMPPHLHYVEPYFGGGAVLMAHDPNDQSLWLSPWVM